MPTPQTHARGRTWIVSLAAASALLLPAGHASANDAAITPGSLFRTTKLIGAQDYWARGLTGRGVDIAVVDTGTAPVDGLDGADKVVFGLDVSFDSQADNTRHYDAYGHGTHMAGIIAARDPDAPLAPTAYVNRPDLTLGVAPDARILSVKAGDQHGAVDVTQVIAAIDWVVAHRRDRGLNVRVLNLSYGTDSVQPHDVSPLAHAVERAWKAGIVVVVAAGNDGALTPKHTDSPGLTTPARDPFVIAVGGTDTRGTDTYADDIVATFSNLGDGENNAKRNPDLVAPGASIGSLRVPGSTLDLAYGAVAASGRHFRGSGTSQAAAVVSGAVALLLQQRPTLTPDGVKDLLRRSATNLVLGAGVWSQGAGQLDLRRALATPSGTARQTHVWSKGDGSLEAARGSVHLLDGSVELRGELDVFGLPVKSADLAARRDAGIVWIGGRWFDRQLAGDGWTPFAVGGTAWAGRGWSGRGWSGVAWSARGWSGRGWSGRGWSGGEWGPSLLPAGWSSAVWSSAAWR